MKISQILSEATKAMKVAKNVNSFIKDDMDDDDDDIVLSLVDTDNANRPDDEDIDEDTLMRIFAVLDHKGEELGAEDLAGDSLTDEVEENITESCLNKMQANALILATALFETCTGKKGQDRDTTDFCEECGVGDEATNSSVSDDDDDEGYEDEDDDMSSIIDDDDELLQDAFRV